MSTIDSRQHGPTWEDVHDYCERLQGTWNAHIVFTTRFYKADKSSRRSASVVVEARESAAVGAPVRAMGFAQFRGTGGASTMPAAMWLALSTLEGKLEGIETVAQSRMPF